VNVAFFVVGEDPIPLCSENKTKSALFIESGSLTSFYRYSSSFISFYNTVGDWTNNTL